MTSCYIICSSAVKNLAFFVRMNVYTLTRATSPFLSISRRLLNGPARKTFSILQSGQISPKSGRFGVLLSPAQFEPMFRWFLALPHAPLSPTTSVSAADCCWLLRTCILHVLASSPVDEYPFFPCSHSSLCSAQLFCHAARAALVVSQWWMVAFASSIKALLTTGQKTSSTQQVLANCETCSRFSWSLRKFSTVLLFLKPERVLDYIMSNVPFAHILKASVKIWQQQNCSQLAVLKTRRPSGSQRFTVLNSLTAFKPIDPGI